MNIIAKRTIPIILLSLTCSYCVQSEPQSKTSVTTDVNPVGQIFTSSDGSFSINLPDKPSKAEPQANDSSKGQMSGYKYTWYTSDGIYNVSYLGFAYRVDDEKSSSQFLDNLRDKLVSKIKGKLQSDDAISIDGHPGREIKIRNADGALIERIYLVNQRLYQLSIFVTKEANEKMDAERGAVKTFHSFKLLPNGNAKKNNTEK